MTARSGGAREALNLATLGGHAGRRSPGPSLLCCCAATSPNASPNVSPRGAAADAGCDATRIIREFCEEVPAARVLPTEAELSAVWSRCAKFHPAAVAEALSVQFGRLLEPALDAYAWQPHARALQVLLHFYGQGGAGRLVGDEAMARSSELVRHLARDMPECAEAAARALEVWQLAAVAPAGCEAQMLSESGLMQFTEQIAEQTAVEGAGGAKDVPPTAADVPASPQHSAQPAARSPVARPPPAEAPPPQASAMDLSTQDLICLEAAPSEAPAQAPGSAPAEGEPPPSLWTCPGCGEPNRQVRDRCNNCGAPRPAALSLRPRGAPGAGLGEPPRAPRGGAPAPAATSAATASWQETAAAVPPPGSPRRGVGGSGANLLHELGPLAVELGRALEAAPPTPQTFVMYSDTDSNPAESGELNEMFGFAKKQRIAIPLVTEKYLSDNLPKPQDPFAFVADHLWQK